MNQQKSYKTPGLLRYKEGDATIPVSAGHRLIIHICNDIGGWGRGFVVALSKRWKKPEEEYRKWFRGQNNFKLGEIQPVEVQSDTTVINMIAQRDIVSDENGVPPLRVDALASCLDKVGELAIRNGSSVHAPRIGAGLAAGVANGYDKDTWVVVESLIIEKLIKRGVNVTIYDLPENKESKG